MGGVRRWLRKIERESRESADTLVLVDEGTGQTHRVPRNAFLLVLAAAGGEEVDPAVEELMPTADDPNRLERLHCAHNGEAFWFEPSARRRREEEAANTAGEYPEDLSEP